MRSFRNSLNSFSSDAIFFILSAHFEHAPRQRGEIGGPAKAREPSKLFSCLNLSFSVNPVKVFRRDGVLDIAVRKHTKRKSATTTFSVVLEPKQSNDLSRMRGPVSGMSCDICGAVARGKMDCFCVRRCFPRPRQVRDFQRRYHGPKYPVQ